MFTTSLLVASLASGLIGCSCGDDDEQTTGGTTPAPQPAPQPTTQPAPQPTTQPSGECSDFDPLRQPFFGDTHVHTSWSFDAYAIGNVANDPQTAYRFARGEAVPKPPFEDDEITPKGGQTIQLRTPLDFAAVTDHAEFYADVDYCTTPPKPDFTCGLGDGLRYVYCTQECVLFRTTGVLDQVVGIDMSFAEWSELLGGTPAERNPEICDEDDNGVSEAIDCVARGGAVWEASQAMTEAANDPCTFTAFHGYEWTRAEGDDSAMLHRNILFRGEEVVERPVTTFEAWDPYDMLAQTRDACAAVDDCAFLAIPHNANLSFGLMFQVEDAEDGTVLTQERAQLRADHEPLIEMVQAKGSSECRNGFQYFSAAFDELCDFEILLPQPLCHEPGADPETCLLECDPDDPNTGVDATDDEEAIPGCQASTDFVRNAMKEGLVQQDRLGINPFRYGFVGSTDTHNGTPGATDEEDFQGSHATLDDEPAEHVDTESSLLANVENPGGLAVVWAEENTRSSLFDAMMRRETYATSGTRILHRFFGGWDYPTDLCDDPDLVAEGYAGGVPMGGTLPGTGTAPTFLAWAARAADLTAPDGTTWPGTPLQRIQIIKVWTDDAGEAHERVFDVTPDPDNGASVDLATCEPSNTGSDELCAVWTDPDFDATERAAYYTRVVEDPSCRWTQRVCNDSAGDWSCDDPEDETYWEGCCDPTIPRTVQERAWGSPIWYDPT